MTYNEFYQLFGQGKGYAKSIFKNEYGERFYVLLPYGSPTVFITGEEYDWEVTQLFNPAFDVYAPDELKGIAKALLKLADAKPKKANL